MNILGKIRRGTDELRDQRAFQRALAQAPTQAARHELEMLRMLGSGGR